jgi:molybdate transport system regulatory protein
MPKSKQALENNAMAAGPAHGQMQLKGRLWVEKSGETFVSWGRAVLLQRIDDTGSVSAAAKSMGMSFSHAWQLVESMNSLSKEPLVAKRAGGKGGGGAWLTAEGKQVVADFWALVADFQKWIDKQSL